MDFVYKETSPPSPIDPNNKWFRALVRGTERAGLKISTGVFPAATDSAYLRQAGVPSFGFSPMPNTPVLLHDHNEFLNERVFLNGIDAFYHVIKEVAEV